MAGKMLIFTIPLMFSGILQLLFNAADTIVVGRYAGSQALAAVGSTTSLINLLVNMFMGLSVGANILISRYYGARKEEDIKETVHTSITVAALAGVVLAVIGNIFACTGDNHTGNAPFVSSIKNEINLSNVPSIALWITTGV